MDIQRFVGLAFSIGLLLSDSICFFKASNRLPARANN